jgi:DMSO/TMAO reductase YedYZ molybdopterin-dependent catalytic subunit
LRDFISWIRGKKSEDLKRLPPGQRLTDKFPVLHYGSIPAIDIDTWDFKVFGYVENEICWNWEEFCQLPRRKVVLDIHCVTHWSKFDTEWEGVFVRDLVEANIIKPKPEAQFVIQHCEHNFTENLPIEIVMADNFLLATHFDGKSITLEHGYPLRGVIGSFPDRSEEKTTYLWKGGKWLRGLEFTAKDRPGFWEMGGYHNEADPWKEQRYSGLF